MHTWKMLVGVMLLACVCPAAVELTEDPPVVKPPRPGNIAGTIKPAGKVASLKAVSRSTGKLYSPEKFNKRSGEFLFKNLHGDATYDICIRTTDGREIEGIDLSWADSRLLRLAAERRKQLKLPPERTHNFSGNDVKELMSYVQNLKDFCDIRRALYIQGHGRRAIMLVELMRTREFHNSGQTVIWRIELWYFENQFGGWERAAGQDRLLRRERIFPEVWRRIHVEYFPALSVFIDAGGHAGPATFVIPESPDPSRGRIAGTRPAQDTAPHVLGLDVKLPPSDAPTGKNRSKP
ncbi:MAG: hypothetical protein SVT52_02520 [Planctomycetota bacterium]|nr:hypothetical protein [Planctomycetota bacterium]